MCSSKGPGLKHPHLVLQGSQGRKETIKMPSLSSKRRGRRRNLHGSRLSISCSNAPNAPVHHALAANHTGPRRLVGRAHPCSEDVDGWENPSEGHLS